MNIEDAIACLKANGYRVSKVRKLKSDLCMEKIVAHQGLNAIGKPYGENYDPNYRMRHRASSLARMSKPYGAGMVWIDPCQWPERCKLGEAVAVQAGRMTLEECRFYGK